MNTWHSGGDAAETLLQRRWFAANRAADCLRAECEVLREVVELAEASWRAALCRLARLDEIQEAIGVELADLDERRVELSPHIAALRTVQSAA